ncbi:MAG: DNA polymerase I [Acidobacterium ailaaui]|nr:DNA polymerase I [Pseudacidobacterium ailaaui]
MQAPKLRLNIRQPTDGAERLQTAAERKKAASETLEEAWQRILSMKNSEADQRKLLEVKTAMESGVIGRDPASLAKRFSKVEALRLHKKLVEIKREETLRNMVENTPDNYWLITDEAKLDDFLSILDNEDEIVFDVETTGTNWHTDYIVGHVISAIKADIHAYIPTKHKTNHPQLSNDLVLNALRPYYENEQIGKLAHNAKFDIHMLRNEGIKLRGLTFDTQVACHVLNENEPSKRLKDLATKYLKIPSQTYDELFGQVGFDSVSDLRVALAYAAKDGDITRKLRDFQRYHLERTKLLEYYETVEVPLIPYVVEMERAGFLLDKDRAKILADEQAEKLRETEKKLREIFGVDDDFNFNSPKQLTELLYGKLKLDRHLAKAGFKRNKDGQYPTDKAALNYLKNYHEGVEFLLEFRSASKSFGTYFDKMPRSAQPDGRVYGQFNQDTTDTGRFSSSEPNMQNIPAVAKTMFIAPPGMVILSGDFSQQEPRILTHASGEPYLTEIYRSGQDFYTNAAAKLFGVPVEECLDGSKYRKMMKTGVLAVMYGTSPPTLAKQLGITKEEAEKFINDFYREYKHVKRFMDGLVQHCKKYGYIRMLYGRKRRVKGINSRNFWERSRAERQIKNSFVQGSAAIQTKKTMIEVGKLCDRKSWQLAFSIHDEIGNYVPETITREDVKEFENVMLNTVKLNVPNKTDIEISRRWGEGMSVDEFFNGPSAVKREVFKTEEEYLQRVDFVRKNWQGR